MDRQQATKAARDVGAHMQSGFGRVPYLPPLRDAKRALASGNPTRIMALLNHFLQGDEADNLAKHLARPTKHPILTRVDSAVATGLSSALTAGVRPQAAALGFSSQEDLIEIARDLRFKLADHGVNPEDLRYSGHGYANLLTTSLNGARIAERVIVMTDGDKGRANKKRGTDGDELEDIDEDEYDSEFLDEDSDRDGSQRESEALDVTAQTPLPGMRRKAKLDALAKKNQATDCFVAITSTYTLEAELLEVGNAAILRTAYLSKGLSSSDASSFPTFAITTASCSGRDAVPTPAI